MYTHVPIHSPPTCICIHICYAYILTPKYVLQGHEIIMSNQNYVPFNHENVKMHPTSHCEMKKIYLMSLCPFSTIANDQTSSLTKFNSCSLILKS